MKKTCFAICAGMIVFGGCFRSATAQTITSEYKEWKNITVEDDGETYEDLLQGVLQVSGNGKYAVASYESFPYPAYIVDVEEGTLNYLKEVTGQQIDRLMAYDVSNDGLIAGAYITSEGLWHPGVTYLGGEWIDLPMPEKANTEYLDYTYLPDYCCIAKRISSDGRVIAGSFPCWDTAYYEDGTSRYSYFWEPCLWFFDPETGEVTGIQEFYGLSYRGQGFVPWDVSDDGSVILGMAETQRGDQCPGLIINGELQYLAAPVLIKEEGYEDAWYEEGNAGGAFWKDGIARCIDKAGNIYYRYQDGTATYHGCKWNMYTDETTEYDDPIINCGVEGFVLGMQEVSYGPAIILDGDQSLADQVSQICVPFSISDDGRVIAGAGIDYSSYAAKRIPAMIVFSESPVTTGIDTVENGEISVTRDGGLIVINGDYDKAELINTSGQIICTSEKELALSGLATGVYIVKVHKGNRTGVYKVLK